jgi:hypothetical protein
MKKFIVVFLASAATAWTLGVFWPSLHTTAFMLNTWAIEWVLLIFLGLGCLFGTWTYSRKG